MWRFSYTGRHVLEAIRELSMPDLAFVVRDSLKSLYAHGKGN